MVYVQNYKNRDSLSFAKDRIVRIVPSYWVISILVSMMAFFLGDYIKTIKFDIGYILLSFSFLSQAISGEEPIVSVGWTLEYEMLFYLIFSITLILKQKKIASLFIFNSLLIFFLILFFKLPIMLEFVLGMLAAIIYLKFDLKKYGILIFTIGLIFYFGSIFIDSKFSKEFRYLIWGLPSFLIILGSVFIEQSKNRLLQKLGNISYSIYLTHVYVIVIIYKFLIILKVPNYLNLYSKDLLIIFIIFLTILISLFFYKFIEMPLTKYTKLLFKV